MASKSLTKHVPRVGGLALLSVLFILVLLTTLTVYMTDDEYMALRRISNLREAEQTLQVGLGSEHFVAKLLERDLIEDNDQASNTPLNDHLQEAWYLWSENNTEFEAEDGKAEIKIADLQGLFNLNNLYPTPTAPGSAANPDANVLTQKWTDAYRQLLIALELPEEELTNTLLDWIDADGTQRLESAEDLDYQILDPPYRAADRPLTTVGELLLIKGYDEEVLEKLLPYVTVLPVKDILNPEPTKLNINTCPALLYHALSEPGNPMDPNDAEQIVTTRQTVTDGWDVETFKNDAAGAVAGVDWEYFNDLVTEVSHYFEVTSTVEFGRVKSKFKSLLHRPELGSQDGPRIWTVHRHRLFL